MLNLKYILLLALISYTLQDIHCLASVETCSKGDDDDDDEERDGGGIAHCVQARDGKCDYCESGYALSYNRESCISFPNCAQLEEEDNNKCMYCEKYYHPNSEGKCVRTLCDLYDDTDKDVCKQCYSGYYLKDNECKKITIPYCKEVEETDETKCKRCVSNLADPVNGKCIVPTTWIKGCDEYDENGKCIKCDEDYTKNGDTCTFNPCPAGTTRVEYCDVCEAGFTEDEDGWCIGHDGTKDTSNATGVKIDFALLIFILAILI